MSKQGADFLIELSKDAKKAEEFMKDPHGTVSAAGLAPEDREVIASGDRDLLRRYFGQDVYAGDIDFTGPPRPMEVPPEVPVERPPERPPEKPPKPRPRRKPRPKPKPKRKPRPKPKPKPKPKRRPKPKKRRRRK